jgi:hypothetical protein
MMTLTPVLSPLHSDCALSIWTQNVNFSYWRANNALLSQAASRSALICFPCFASCRCRLYVVHFSRRRLASVFRAPAPPPLPLRLHSAPSAAVHAALFATSQIQQPLYIAGHMQHFMRVFIPRDHLQQQNPRQELLHFATMVQRVVSLHIRRQLSQTIMALKSKLLQQPMLVPRLVAFAACTGHGDGAAAVP